MHIIADMPYQRIQTLSLSICLKYRLMHIFVTIKVHSWIQCPLWHREGINFSRQVTMK